MPLKEKWVDKVNNVDYIDANDINSVAHAVIEAEEKMIPVPVTPMQYGAVGDGVTDDTAAFKKALEENRIVYVPGGTYILSDELIIHENCCFELSQDTVLKFTQTNANCITMLRLANLKGNHATITVPYMFNANVINCDTREDENSVNNSADINATAVPPFTKWDPQWKMSRYITDINICKPQEDGKHNAINNQCYGKAVYFGCNEQYWLINFMWGVSVSGLRIAGGFTHGIHIYNTPNENDIFWNHDMRIEAIIDSCEIGVLVENCHCVRLAVTIQPRKAENGTLYAKHGFKLSNSRNVDLTSSRVWDWNEMNTLCSQNAEYQHIAMYGQCRGLLLDDFLYYEQSAVDIRKLIYTDTPSNLENMTVLQEPITRWFKPKDGDPYFYDGVIDKKLLTDDALDTYFQVDTIKNYTDVLVTATDTDGTIFNEIGYMPGYRFASLGSGTDLVASSYYMTTGFIAVKPGDTIYTKDLRFVDSDNMSYAGIVYYNNERIRFASMANANVVNGVADYVTGYTETANGCSFKIANSGVLSNNNLTYVRFVFPTSGMGANPAIAVNEEIKQTVEGFLSDGVKVKSENVVYLDSAIDARLRELGLIN